MIITYDNFEVLKAYTIEDNKKFDAFTIDKANYLIYYKYNTLFNRVINDLVYESTMRDNLEYVSDKVINTFDEDSVIGQSVWTNRDEIENTAGLMMFDEKTGILYSIENLEDSLFFKGFHFNGSYLINASFIKIMHLYTTPVKH